MLNLILKQRPRWVALIVLLLCTPNAQADKASILVLGDSISAAYGLAEKDGWVQLLAQRLQQAELPYQVVNASISGDTTSGGLARLATAFEQHRPHILVIELGGNDGLRGLSLKKMRKNLSAMVKQCIDNGCRPAILGMRIPTNYGEAYTERFQGSFARVAEENNTPLVAFFLEGVATEESLMQDDGIHPNATAQPQLLENAWAVIQPLLDGGRSE